MGRKEYLRPEGNLSVIYSDFRLVIQRRTNTLTSPPRAPREVSAGGRATPAKSYFSEIYLPFFHFSGISLQPLTCLVTRSSGVAYVPWMVFALVPAEIYTFEFQIETWI